MKKIILLIVILCSAFGITHAQWTKVYSMMSGIHSINLKGDTVLITCWGKGIAFSPDDGITWEFRNTGIGSLFTGRLGLKGEDAYVSVPAGIYYSSNFGESWELRSSILDGKLVQQFYFDEDKIYACTNKGLFVSDDKALTWEDISSNIGPKVFTAFSKDEDGTPYLAVLDDGLYTASHQDSVPWLKVDLGKDSVNISQILTANNVIYLATEKDNILYQEDGGGWKKHIILEGCEILDLKFYQNRLFAAILDAAKDAGGLFYSSDLGKTWTPKNEGLKLFNMRHIAINEKYIYSAVWGSGIYRAPIDEFLPVREIDESVSEVYPNPADDLINIPDMPAGIIKIYDSVGKDIATVKVENYKANVSFLYKGVYIIKVVNKSFTFVKQ